MQRSLIFAVGKTDEPGNVCDSHTGSGADSPMRFGVGLQAGQGCASSLFRL